ncbi:MAG: hypothetical protein M0D55_15505 [Elusimicrobiota bacterium]|nr:MAG: hypothetical protein M0D55_15505 [Elusimicrobiota bacterium]
MIKLLLVLVTAATASFASAQSFETQIEDSLRPFVAADAFAEVPACGVLDIKTIRPIALDEAADMIKPCVEGVAKLYAAKAAAEPGMLSAPQSGKPGQSGLLIKTDLTAGSKGHRDLVASLSRREGRILGHMTRVMTKNETAPAASASVLQKAIDGCLLLTVVRDIRSGEDFVKVYGKCLTRDESLKIKELRAAEGLVVTLKTAASGSEVEAYNGFVTVNAGKGPVQVMVVAYASNVFLPL